jgi:hypothetical protein
MVSNEQNSGVLKMSRLSQHQEQALGQPVPLFSSSWVALFVLLRENLSKGGAWNAAASVSPKTGYMDGPH